jgi:hypothetical protein
VTRVGLRSLVAAVSIAGWIAGCATAEPQPGGDDDDDDDIAAFDAAHATGDAHPGSPDAASPGDASGPADAALPIDAALPPDAAPPPDASSPPDASPNGPCSVNSDCPVSGTCCFFFGCVPGTPIGENICLPS